MWLCLIQEKCISFGLQSTGTRLYWIKIISNANDKGVKEEKPKLSSCIWTMNYYFKCLKRRISLILENPQNLKTDVLLADPIPNNYSHFTNRDYQRMHSQKVDGSYEWEEYHTIF